MRAAILAGVLVFPACGAGKIDPICEPENFSEILSNCPDGTVSYVRLSSSLSISAEADIRELSAAGYYAEDDECIYTCVDSGEFSWECDGGDVSAQFQPSGSSIRYDASDWFAQGSALQPIPFTISEPGTLTFCEGTFFTHINVTADANIMGAGPGETILSGGGRHRVIEARGVDLRASALSLSEGRRSAWLEDALRGVGVNSDYLPDSRVGGALFAHECVLSLSEVSVVDSESVMEGGAVGLFDSHTTMSDVRLARNTAQGHGGAIFLRGGSLAVQDSAIEDNVSSSRGGGIYASEAELVLQRSTLQNNRADYGGAICAYEVELAMEECSLLDNEARGGAGMQFLSYSTGSISRSLVEGNVAREDGGGISSYNETRLTLYDVDFIGNSAEEGGAIHLGVYWGGPENGADISLRYSTIRGNDAELGGGVFLSSQGELEIDEPDFSGNTDDDAYSEPLGLSFDWTGADPEERIRCVEGVCD